MVRCYSLLLGCCDGIAQTLLMEKMLQDIIEEIAFVWPDGGLSIRPLEPWCVALWAITVLTFSHTVAISVL